MTRARLLAAALAAAACGDGTPTTPGAQLRQPAGIAVFRGVTLEDPDPANPKPYLAIANAGRNDLTFVDAADDSVVLAPVQLRPLAVPVPNRPALLASASLGDAKADLLVVVSAGDSVLQVVSTWEPSNTVFSNPAPPPPESPLAIDLGADVLALAAVPAPPGTARIAAALAGNRIALVEYVRAADGEAVARNASTIRTGLPFQPVAIVAMPGDADAAAPGVQTALYAATLDEIEPGVFGVAEIPVAGDGTLGTVRALGARAPTRLVAAARLQERQGRSAAADAAAFAGQPVVPRVYAVLDEGSCGPGRRIDCGVVTLDPEKAQTDGDAIPDDWASVMPYREPIRLPARVAALAASPAPANPAQGDTAGFMRLALDADSVGTTTGVGVAATEDGNLHFLDLGRFTVPTATDPATSVATAASPPPFDATTRRRLWVLREGATFAADVTEGRAAVTTTAGHAPTETWTLTWQGILPGLGFRLAEAGLTAGDAVWLAIQVADGRPTPARAETQVAQVYHPALGVRAGDIAVLRAQGVPGCVGTLPPGVTAEDARVFEARVAALLAPTDDYPGGALQLQADSTQPEWATCFEALRAAAPTDAGARRLRVDVRAGELLLAGASLGYAGRPALAADATSGAFQLQYEDEDAISCPLADWSPPPPAPACDDAGCRDRCERLVVARKLRRVHHHVLPGAPSTGAVVGPTLRFAVALQADGDPSAPPVAATPVRGQTLSLSTASGILPLVVDPGGAAQPSGALAFDRSPLGSPGDYRFFVSYPADLVVDVSPNASPPSLTSIR